MNELLTQNYPLLNYPARTESKFKHQDRGIPSVRAPSCLFSTLAQGIPFTRLSAASQSARPTFRQVRRTESRIG